MFHEHGYDPGLLAECVRRCLAQTENRPAVTLAQSHGLAVVGTSLLLELNRATRGKLTLDLKVHSVPDVVRSAMEAATEIAQKKDIAVRFVDPAETMCARADGDRLQQVFRNVVHVRDTGEGSHRAYLLCGSARWT